MAVPLCLLLGSALGAPRKPVESGAAWSSCDAALEEACSSTKSEDVFACAGCTAAAWEALEAAGCDNDTTAAWCVGVAPPSPPPTLPKTCSAPTDCPIGQYCGSSGSCYSCDNLSSAKAKCDALGGDCCSAAFLQACPSNPQGCGPTRQCEVVLESACGTARGSMVDCLVCGGVHASTVRGAGCSNDDIHQWCDGGGAGPTPPPPSPPPPPPPASLPTFAVSASRGTSTGPDGPDGKCTVTAGGACFRSPNYPHNYLPAEDCTFTVSGSGLIRATAFQTYDDRPTFEGYDYLTIEGTRYSGDGGALSPTGAGVAVRDGQEITWHSDFWFSDGDSGFEICGAPAPPEPPPPPPTPPPPPSPFPGSRLITDAAWGATLNGWAGMEGQEWALCCSTFEGCDTAKKFHAGCDAHAPTLTVAHNAGGTNDYGDVNPGGFTFGGFVRTPSSPACGL